MHAPPRPPIDADTWARAWEAPARRPTPAAVARRRRPRPPRWHQWVEDAAAYGPALAAVAIAVAAAIALPGRAAGAILFAMVAWPVIQCVADLAADRAIGGRQ